MTPLKAALERLDDLAAELLAQARGAGIAGDAETARRLRDQARGVWLAMDALRSDPHPLSDMNRGQS